jgi:hypothetical protein
MVGLLKSTVWGSRASRYRILGLPEKLARLRDPSFFTLVENGHELGVIVIDRCAKDIMGRPCGAYHFVMAATDPDRRNEGLAGIILDKVRAFCIATVGQPGFGFTYVEATTEFSLRLSDRIGHAVEADIPLTLFSRLFPKEHDAVVLLDPSEEVAMTNRLEDLYSDHELGDFARSLNPEEYFVLGNGAQILAGVQAEVIRWSVVEMPGLAGWFLMNVFPMIPLSKCIIDLRDLRIVRLGNLFVPQGNEGFLSTLMEAVLAREKAKLGLIMLDGRSPVFQRIRDHGRRGLLSGALKGSAKVRIAITGMDDDMLAQLSSRPLLVSPADVF